MAGIKAMEIYRERREHAERRHKDACEEMVGYYNDESLDYKKPAAATDVETDPPVNIHPFLAAFCEAGAIQYVTAPSAT